MLKLLEFHVYRLSGLRQAHPSESGERETHETCPCTPGKGKQTWRASDDGFSNFAGVGKVQAQSAPKRIQKRVTQSAEWTWKEDSLQPQQNRQHEMRVSASLGRGEIHDARPSRAVQATEIGESDWTHCLLPFLAHACFLLLFPYPLA